MRQARPVIPLHKLDARASGGLDIRQLYQRRPEDGYALEEHRDDHYIMAVLTEGSGTMSCDMERLSAKAPAILIIKPFQVHAVAETWEPVSGYFLSIAPFLVPEAVHLRLQQLSLQQQCFPLASDALPMVSATLELLCRTLDTPHTYRAALLKGLLDTLIYRVLDLCPAMTETTVQQPAAAQRICEAFRNLIQQHSFRQPPSFFAAQLYVSTAHLNDCVRSVSGYPVTYWLQDSMLLEAKRLLYYTDLQIKNVAYELGFSDHTYFSRLFRKLSGETPLDFRRRFRE